MEKLLKKQIAEWFKSRKSRKEKISSSNDNNDNNNDNIVVLELV